MGGKTKTYSDLNAYGIFDENDNLFSKDLVRTTAYNGSLVSPIIIRSMIQNVIQYFNPRFLRAHGVEGIIGSDVEVIPPYSFRKKIIEDLGWEPPGLIIEYHGMRDASGKDIGVIAYRLKQYLEKLYEVDKSKKHTFVYHYDLNDESFAEVNVDTHLYYRPGSKYGFMIDDPIQFDGSGRLRMRRYRKEPGGWVPDGYDWVYVALDNRVYYLIVYKYNNVYGMRLVPRNEFEAYVEPMSVLLIPIKDNFQFVETKSYQRSLLSNYGFDWQDLKESLSDENIKASFITYSASTNDFENLPQSILDDIDAFYGRGDEVNYIAIRSPYYAIEYQWTFCWPWFGDECEDEGYIPQITVEGTTFDIGDKKLYMVPVDNLLKLSMQEKYNFIRDTMCIWGNMEQEVHLAWYQTGFFKFVMFAVGVAFAWATYGASIKFAIAIIGSVAVSIIARELGPVAAIIASVLLVGVSNWATTGSLSLPAGSDLIDYISKNWYDITLKGVKTVSQMYFKHELGKIQDEISEYSDKTKEYTEQLKDLEGQYLYMPIKAYEDEWYVNYKLDQSIYSARMFNPMADYEELTKLGA